MIATITPGELAQKLQSNEDVELIDVRTPAEFQAVHATPARNVPFHRLRRQEVLETCNGSEEKPLYVICQAGVRSRKACEKLAAAGCQNVVSVEGGTAAWEAAGLPVVRGEQAVSLERQVRIVAGSLVLTGALLAIFVHPWWAGLSAFVGAGLLFSGITNTCGMGMLLARMPWNQVQVRAECRNPNDESMTKPEARMTA
jgi:rhodanese-related sulfurtransferase